MIDDIKLVTSNQDVTFCDYRLVSVFHDKYRHLPRYLLPFQKNKSNLHLTWSYSTLNARRPKKRSCRYLYQLEHHDDLPDRETDWERRQVVRLTFISFLLSICWAKTFLDNLIITVRAGA